MLSRKNTGIEKLFEKREEVRSLREMSLLPENLLKQERRVSLPIPSLAWFVFRCLLIFPLRRGIYMGECVFRASKLEAWV